MLCGMLSLVATLALSPTADAGGWEAKTMQDPLSQREIERPLIIGKGWLEAGIGADVKSATGYWSSDGELVEFQDATWLYTTERLHIRYGIAPRAELYWIVKGHYLSLQNESLGTNTSGLYWGDPRFGWRFEVLRTAAPLTSVATVVEMKVPLGNESSGSFIAGPSSLQNFVTTTGTADLRLGVDGKRQLIGPLAAGGSLGYVYRFSNIVQYLLETENNQFHGRIKPGPQVYLDASLMAQLGPVALSATPGVEWHGPVAMGTTSSGLVPDRDLEIVEGSDGWSADVDLGVVGNITRNIDLIYGLNVPLRGEDLLFFPIEDIHPTYGLTHSATLELRY